MKQEKFSIVFLGTDYISLQGLNQLLKRPEFKITGIITQPSRSKGRGLHCISSPVAQRAKELSLPILTPDNLQSPEFLSEVENLKAKWAVLLSYGKILPGDFLSLFPKRALNFHASLLPRWRGAAPIQRAIMAGDRELGMSLQVMEPQLDTGPLIGLRSFKMEIEMDAADAFNKMELLIQELLTDLLEYMKGHCIPVPQDENQAVYAHKIDKKESQIVWNAPSIKIFNQIRALVRGPQAYTFYNEKRIKIYKAQCFLEDSSPASPGQIVDIGSDYFKVACRDSILSIIQLQPESKKIMSAGEYIKGYNLKMGACLG